MSELEKSAASLRVVIFTPTGKDAELTAGILEQAELECYICPTASCVEAVINEGAGVLLVAEEALISEGVRDIKAALSRQPPWSDLPVLLLTRYGADSPTVGESLQALRNVTLLERPVRPATLLSSIRTALKARERQYQVGLYLEEQERTNAQLAESIRERARVEEALREADQRKDEFIATLAHELRNPLAPIRNALHILRLSTTKDPKTEQIGEMIERQVEHLVRLVDDLMEVSRITRGQVELRKEIVDLSDILRTAVESSRPLIEGARHQLATSLPKEPLLLYADPIRLAQVFANLLNNAAKYMQPGGQIWLNVRRQQDEVMVAIRDTGVGIDPDMLPHIFKMFTQVDRSKRQAQGGLGIGLTLVRTLVEMHGGEVEASSAGLDQGSEFVVRLPLEQDPSAIATAHSQETRVAIFGNHRILVVDDNRDAATSLGKLLQLLGADVLVVHDGPSALEVLESFQPMVVLLDIGMPGMDGYEVARRIRDQDQWRNLMLIALTGWGQEEDRDRASRAGFDHHLLKPADIGALRSLMTSLDAKDEGSYN